MPPVNEYNIGRKNKQTRLSHEWGPGQKLLIHERQVGDILNTQKRVNQLPIPQVADIQELVWNSELFEEPKTRAMISEAAILFDEIRESVAIEPLSVSDLLRMSRRYRSVIHAAHDNLENEKLRKTFQEIEISWHICEILFVDIQAPGLLLTQLLSWIRWHYLGTNTLAEEVLAARLPHENPSYWDVVFAFIITGQPENARAFLNLSPEAKKKEEYGLVMQVLAEMPIFTSDQLNYEFDIRWQKWSSDCSEILRTGYLDNHEKLKTILQILAGDESVITSFIDKGFNWFQLMTAQLLYTDPLIKENNLIELAQECVTKYASPTSTKNTFDKVLLAAFSYDLMEVLRQACYFQNDDNWWFVSHFVDLLHQGNQLESHQVENQEQLREFLLLDYADSLISQGSMWQVAVVYYDACEESGKQRLQLTLERLPFDNERKAMKIIDVAEKRNLSVVAKSISRILATKWLNRNKLSQALTWALRSEDVLVCTHIADLYLQHYIEHNKFPDTDLLSSLGVSMLISDRLTFLAKFHECHQIRNDGRLKEAGTLLESLISSRISPRDFQMTLLMDTLPLLEARELVFNAEQTYSILASLEELLDSKIIIDLKKDKDDAAVFQEKEDILRLAIARNTARAFIS